MLNFLGHSGAPVYGNAPCDVPEQPNVTVTAPPVPITLSSLTLTPRRRSFDLAEPSHNFEAEGNAARVPLASHFRSLSSPAKEASWLVKSTS